MYVLQIFCEHIILSSSCYISDITYQKEWTKEKRWDFTHVLYSYIENIISASISEHKFYCINFWA